MWKTIEPSSPLSEKLIEDHSYNKYKPRLQANMHEEYSKN